MMKIIPDSGAYYKFTVIDKNKKAFLVKIDNLHSRPKWNAIDWA